MIIPNFKEYLNEGMLTNYRTEKEGKKISGKQMNGTFDVIIGKLIDEKIPFYFDCKYQNYTKIGFLMNKQINQEHFNGYIFENDKDSEHLKNFFKTKMLPEIEVEKPGKLHIGRTNFADLTHATDLETITVVVKAFKSYYKDKNISNREISGNKYEANVNIDFLCDTNTINNIIDYVF